MIAIDRPPGGGAKQRTLRHVSIGGRMLVLDAQYPVQTRIAERREPRPIIILQGPVGGFFSELGRELNAIGVPALKVNFNLADHVFETRVERILCKASATELADWFRTLFLKRRPRAVAMFSDMRPIHVVARSVCKNLNIPVFSFEEGYVRPNFVTMERDGNNANSQLRSDSLEFADLSPPSEETRWGSNFPHMAARAAAYQTLLSLGRPLFPDYVHHKKRKLLPELACWTKYFWRAVATRRQDTAISEKIATASAGRYYVLALQVFDDLQLLRHGRGWTSQRLIEACMESFSSHAPSDAQLIIKQHPLDTGHQNYTGLVRALGTKYKISDRVIYLRGANQQMMLQHAKGLVTINSTVGVTALSLGCPVLNMGHSFYTRPGLAQQAENVGCIDAFWTDPRPVDAKVFRAFRGRILGETQVNGDYYIPGGRRSAAAIAARRLSRVAEEESFIATRVSTEVLEGRLGQVGEFQHR